MDEVLENNETVVEEVGASEPVEIDLSSLENQLTELIELYKENNEETEPTEEELKKLNEAQQSEKDYKNTLIENIEESKTVDENILQELETLNSNLILIKEEELAKTNEYLNDGFATVSVTLCVVVALKVFVDQITKW